jgi:hypothetical protein
MARAEDLSHRHRGRVHLKSNFVNQLTTGRNRDASLGPTSSWRGLLGGRGWPAQCYLIPPPGGALARAYTGNTKSICTRGAVFGVGGELATRSSRHRPTKNRCLGMCQKSGWRTIQDRGIRRNSACEPHRFFNRRDSALARVFFLARLGLECSGQSGKDMQCQRPAGGQGQDAMCHVAMGTTGAANRAN